jgi:MFS family permease
VRPQWRPEFQEVVVRYFTGFQAAVTLPGRLLPATPADPDQRRVLLAGLADALGSGLFLPISVIYLTRIVGLSPTRVGLGLTIAGIVAVVATPCAGPLLDRFGARTTVMACFTVSALGFLAYLTVDSFATFIAVAIVLQFASRMDRPATAVLVLGVAPGRDQAEALAWQSTIRNLGLGLGGLLAGLALLIRGRTPFDVLLASNAVSYMVASALVFRLPVIRPAASRPGNRSERPGYLQVARDRVYMGLACLNVLACLHDSVLIVAMPLWISLRTRAPLWISGLLFALNTVLVVLLQVRATRSAATPKGITHSYRTAAIGFALAGACFAITAGPGRVMALLLLVLAVSALTIGELEVTAGEQFLSTELAPERFRGRYLSVYKTSMSVQQAIGPALVTVLLVDWGRAGWFVIALILVAGSLGSQRLGAGRAARRPSLEGQLDGDSRPGPVRREGCQGA